MTTVPCLYGDGECKIRDRTLVIRDGVAAVVAREEIEAEFPSIELEDALEMVSVSADTVAEIMDALDDRDAPPSDIALATDISLVDDLVSEVGEGTWVLVHCTPCNHTLKVRL